jgi:hypothetical protein
MSLREIEIFASCDWGWNSPGCVLFWLCLADGHFHIISEIKFQRKNAFELGDMVKKRVAALGVGRLRYVAADPAIWQHTGAGKGESIAETLSRRPISLPMKKSDNDRLNGWQRVHELLGTAPDGRPWLTVDESCTYLRRTIPAAVSDKADAENVDTNIDDHALDALRYGAMSRPSPTRLVLESQLTTKMAGHLFKQAVEAARPGWA